MKVHITLQRNGEAASLEYDYQQHKQQLGQQERPTGLDVLLAAQQDECFDLSYRYGCRNGLCGVCTIDVNGKAKLACRTKLRAGDTLSAMHVLPAVRDLVVRRDRINQQLQGRLPVVETREEHLNQDHTELVSLNRCIECYACMDGCPVHERNNLNNAEAFAFGNPYSFLKIQRVLVNPAATEQDKKQAITLARSLGIMEYKDKKVPGCGVGIDLKREVIAPLLRQCEAEVQAEGDS